MYLVGDRVNIPLNDVRVNATITEINDGSEIMAPTTGMCYWLETDEGEAVLRFGEDDHEMKLVDPNFLDFL